MLSVTTQAEACTQYSRTQWKCGQLYGKHCKQMIPMALLAGQKEAGSTGHANSGRHELQKWGLAYEKEVEILQWVCECECSHPVEYPEPEGG